MANIQVTTGKSSSTATIDGIQFNKIPTSGTKQLLLVTRQNNPFLAAGNYTDIIPSINAVDIDWNEAVVNTGFLSDPSKTIKTTGDLLYWLQQDLITASQQVSTLEGQVTTLQNTNADLTERIVKLETLVSGLYSALADTSN